MKKIEKLYPHLTPEERFYLALDALHKGNDEELELLFFTCPRKTYSFPDLAFLDPLKAIRYITLGFCLIWECSYTQLLTIQKGLLAYYLNPEGLNKGEFEELCDLESEIGNSLEIHWKGFVVFCQEKNLDPELLLSTFFPPVLEQVKSEQKQWASEAIVLKKGQEEPGPQERKGFEILRESFSQIWEIMVK